jgi:hypothetical protein
MNSKVLFDEDGWKRLLDEVPKVHNCQIVMFLFSW